MSASMALTWGIDFGFLVVIDFNDDIAYILVGFQYDIDFKFYPFYSFMLYFDKNMLLSSFCFQVSNSTKVYL